MGDERPRHAPRQCALPVDAGGRAGETADGGGSDHRRARSRGRSPRRGGAAAPSDVAARAGPRGIAAVRICVVGCGAVGSLFAANLAQLDDVETWTKDLAREHVDAINRAGLRLTGAGELVGRLRATN